MSTRIDIEAAAVAAQIDALYTEYPELEEDDALRDDMLEGTTDLHSVLSRIIDHRQEALAFVKAINLQVQDKNERAARYERRSEAMGALAKRLMDAAGVDKVVLPEATVSITKARESVIILDADGLPQGYFQTIRQPDKRAIGDALKAGQDIPGAALKWGSPGLAVRTK